MTPLRTAVVGLGYFGRFHARHHAANPETELVAVCDPDTAAAERVAAEFGGAVVADHRELIGMVDAASVAVPTTHHARVAGDLIAAGIHVLVEKPVTETLGEADELVALAKRSGVVLQVGHIESFSTVFRELRERVSRPHYLEARRVAPWRGRATDVSVVLDLMIHDIDLVLALAGAAPERIEGFGLPVLSGTEDVARARLTFPDGTLADLFASRVGDDIDRRLTVYEEGVVHECDFTAHRLARRVPGHGDTAIDVETTDVERRDALAAEVAEFVRSVRERREPPVTGERGRDALAVALRVMTDARARRAALARQPALSA